MAGGETILISDWVVREASWFFDNFTPVVIAVFSLYVIYWTYKLITKKLDKRDIFFIIFIWIGAVHIVLFFNGAFVHQYWQWYIIPAVVIGSAVLLTEYYNKIIKRRRYPRITGTVLLSIFIVTVSILSFVELKKLHEKTEIDILAVAAMKTINKKTHYYDKVETNWELVANEGFYLDRNWSDSKNEFCNNDRYRALVWKGEPQIKEGCRVLGKEVIDNRYYIYIK